MKKTYVCSIGLVLLTLEFIFLKVIGLINWSWIWVLSPIWIVLLIAGIVTVSLIFGLKNEEKVEKPKTGRASKGGLLWKLEQLQEAQERLQNEKKQQR